ncbi:enoyl-CoA delta isomerase 1, mitochondrial-like, partial [Armigeres subalbatus]|uniref:enoyl-CoA delta isomerase 1, mitochondrial-like n=1 Tax=Armigeres subalbatus TaxID=124917 RepID=UPI002ED4DA48
QGLVRCPRFDGIDNKTGYATVTMNRAPVNSLNLELMTQLVKAVDDLERSNVKGLILTSSFSKVFSAGLDIAEMINPNPDRLRAVWGILQDLWLGKLKVCLKGRMFSSQEALEKGLVDELAADKENGKKKALDYLNIFTNTSSYARTEQNCCSGIEILKT